MNGLRNNNDWTFNVRIISLVECDIFQGVELLKSIPEK